MVASKSLGSKESHNPVLLKTTRHSKCLEIKIGNLGLELWDFPNDEVKPYARLIFEPDESQGMDVTDESEGDTQRLCVDLDVLQAGAISVAIEQWLLSFESETKDENVPSLHIKISCLCMRLYPQANGQGAKAELAVRTQRGVQARAVLTRLETSLLGTLLESLVDEEEGSSGECAT